MDTQQDSTSQPAQIPPQPEGGAEVRFPPPLVPLIGLAAGFVLAKWGGDLGAPLTGALRYSIGAVVFALGVALLVLAGRRFQETGQDPKPWVASPELIATGVYLWTRNPMYIGMGALQAAIGILAANAWMVVLVPVTWLTIYLVAIRHEEKYLEAKFGDSYRGYKKSVRRWI